MSKRKFILRAEQAGPLVGRLEINYEKDCSHQWAKAVATIDEKEETLTCVLDCPIEVQSMNVEGLCVEDDENAARPAKQQKRSEKEEAVLEVEARAVASKRISLQFHKPEDVKDVTAPELAIPGLFKMAVDGFRCYCSLGSVVDASQEYRAKPNQDNNTDADYVVGWYGRDHWQTKYQHMNPDNFLHWVIVVSKEIKSGCIHDVLAPITRRVSEKTADERNLLSMLLTTLFYVIHGTHVDQRESVVSALLMVISNTYLGVGLSMSTPHCEQLLEQYIRGLKAT